MKVAIPKEIMAAIDALLGPYDLSIEQLLKRENDPAGYDPELYIEINAATKIFNFSRSTLYRAAKRGDIEVSKLSGARSGKVLIEKQSLILWLKSKKQYR